MPFKVESTGIWDIDDYKIVAAYAQPSAGAVTYPYDIRVGSNSDRFNIVDSSGNVVCRANDTSDYKEFRMTNSSRYSIKLSGGRVNLSGTFKTWAFGLGGQNVYMEFHFRGAGKNKIPNGFTDSVSIIHPWDSNDFWFSMVVSGVTKMYHVNILSGSTYGIDYSGALIRPKGDNEVSEDINTIPDVLKIIRLVKYTGDY